jgi:spore maturation protein CgeB
VKLVIFGLSVSSAWGNGHATLWRGLLRSLIRRGHYPVFFEKDVPYYARNRDLWEIPGGKLILYSDWHEVLHAARCELRDAEVTMITSYCPDAVAASELMLDMDSGFRVFYDLDTPVTLAGLDRGENVAYVGENGLRDFHLVFSYTGGSALGELSSRLGAPHVEPLYGSVDPETHFPVESTARFEAGLSYLGTYAADRQAALEALLIEPARNMPEERFLLGGSQYPEGFPWMPNIHYAGHVSPPEHPQFYCSAKLNLSVTRQAMAAMGYCPSGRLFEAAACAAPVLTDDWEGLDCFFEPGREILVAAGTAEAIDHLSRSESDLRAIGSAARDRVLGEHTADHRALEFEAALDRALDPQGSR